jgi:hypothetical protein
MGLRKNRFPGFLEVIHRQAAWERYYLGSVGPKGRKPLVDRGSISLELLREIQNSSQGGSRSRERESVSAHRESSVGSFARDNKMDTGSCEEANGHYGLANLCPVCFSTTSKLREMPRPGPSGTASMPLSSSFHFFSTRSSIKGEPVRYSTMSVFRLAAAR